jgi:hypothetical protein
MFCCSRKLTIPVISLHGIISSTSKLSFKDTKKLIDKAFRYERLLSEINEANDWLYLEQLIVYSEDNLPLISFELNKGKRLRPEEKETILAEIKTSIQEQKPFTSLSLFEMRVHDLEFFEYSYFIDKLEIRNLYQYQIFHKQYLKA